MKTWILITLAALLATANASAQKFDCNSVLEREHNEQFFHLSGELTKANGIQGVEVALVANGKDHEMIKDSSEILPVRNFNPRSEKLKSYDKFLLQESGKDKFYLFLPLQIQSAHFRAYVKFSYDGTYPDLEPLECSLLP